ncbi:lipopolysaccharide biosynthesis protein [Vibrio breoganii]
MIKTLFKVVSSNFIYFGAMWFLLAFVSRFYGLAEMGILSLSIAISTPIILLFGMSPRQTIVTGVVNEYHKYKNNRNITLLFALLLLIMGSYITIENEMYCSIFILFSIFKFIESYYETTYAIKTKNKDFNYISALQLIRSGQVLVFIIVSYISDSLVSSIISLILYNLSLILFIKESHLIDKSLEIGDVISTLKKTIPISLAGFLTLLFLNTPRYFIANISITDVALYSGLVNIVAIIRMAIQSYLNTILPYLTDAIKQGNRTLYFKMLIKGMLSIFIISIFTFIIYTIVGNELFQYIYGSEFKVNSLTVYLCILYGSLLCMAMVMNNALTSLKKFRAQLNNSFLLNIMSFTLSLIIIPSKHIDGAFVVLIFVCISQIALCAIELLKMRFNINVSK